MVGKMKNIALQLYSVKDFTEKDFIGTIQKIAGYGYTGVEFAGYGGLTAAELKNLLVQTGLAAHGAHVGYEKLTSNLDGEIEYARMAGVKYIVCPHADIKTKDDALRISEEFKKIIEKCKANGLGFAYHNHAHEFNKDSGEFLLDILYDNTPGLDMELDVYWVAYAGVDVFEYMKKFNGRLPLIHLKEMAVDKTNVDIGRGILDFPEIIRTAKELGTRIFIVEQESGNADQMTSAQSNVEYLSKIPL
jgi:sugar phosphate isomerase/epimerase